jgi:hypothetical protein
MIKSGASRPHRLRHFPEGKGWRGHVVIIGDVLTSASQYLVRMNLGVCRAFVALRVVAERGRKYHVRPCS